MKARPAVEPGVSDVAETMLILERTERPRIDFFEGLPARRSGSAGRYYINPSDPDDFYRRHPECELNAERLAALEPLVKRATRWMAARAGQSAPTEDFCQAILEGIIQNGLSYVHDENGEPVFDFFDQGPSYIVQRGVQRAEPLLRALHRDQEQTRSNWQCAGDDGDEEDRFESLAGNSADPASQLAYRELCRGLADELTTTQRAAFELLVSGVERSEIANRLGVSRQSAHALLERIADRTRLYLEQSAEG